MKCHLTNSFFPEYSKLQNSIKKEVISSSLKVIPSVTEISKTNVKKSLPHITFWNTNQIMKSKKLNGIKDQSIDNKQKKVLPQVKSSIQQNITSISSLPNDNKLPPLCWSDLFQQNYSEVIQLSSSSLSKDKNSTNEMNSMTGFIKKSVWRPANSIVS
ncbi:hypothetical protein EWB00_005297 [Schistosoma japonicum]|uniref:Uncharacterized protein n=1 Tax=Schistosoma japonicum TaxID=6182 RepID=A0A4Z2D2A4_SCHJA|nr:hypothetical protein EWB00_005297 [Schistosoma japonicum]